MPGVKLLDLAADFFESAARPKLIRDFPQLSDRLAAGLVGNGSECFGYDDELSRDHDWGVDFFLWTTEADAPSIPALRRWKAALLETLPPAFRRQPSPLGASPDVSTARDFYVRLLGCARRPVDGADWLRIPEENLAMATNGRIFCDGAGEFTAIRSAFLAYYPEDVRKKRLAARCMALAQTGQYNLPRCLARGDTVTARLCLARFTEAAMGAVFLLNRRYLPYYKWRWRMLAELPVLGVETAKSLAALDRPETSGEGVEALCARIADELRRQGLSAETDSFLAAHGRSIQASIGDDFLRGLPAQYGA